MKRYLNVVLFLGLFSVYMVETSRHTFCVVSMPQLFEDPGLLANIFSHLMSRAQLSFRLCPTGVSYSWKHIPPPCSFLVIFGDIFACALVTGLEGLTMDPKHGCSAL